MTIYLYELSDPRTGEVRYVGKSVNPKERLASHIRAAKQGDVVHCRRWIAGLLAEGMRPAMQVVAQCPDNYAANLAERTLIKERRALGSHLTNRTDGGDGQSPGYQWSEQARDRLRQSVLGRKHTEQAKAALRATLSKPEQREARSQRSLALMSDPVLRAKCAAGRRGMPASEDTKRRIAASWTPERKAKHAAEKSALPVDDRWRDQLKAALKARWDKYRARQAHHS